MNGVDYTKQLQKDRDYFRETIQKDRKNSDQRIEDAEKRHKVTQEKTSEKFIQDKADLEKNFQNKLNDIKDKTQADSHEQNSKYHQQLNKERDNFQRESQIRSKDFDQRLNDIKSNYDKSFNAERTNHKELENVQKKRYERNVSDLVKKTDDQTKQFQNKLMGEGSNLKDQHNRERQQMVRAQENQIQKVYEEQGEKQNELKRRLGDNLQKTKEIHEADKKHLQTHTQQQLDQMRHQSEDRYQTMTQDYSQRSDKLVGEQKRETLRANQEHQKQMSDAQRSFNKQLNQLELEKNRTKNGSSEFSKFVEEQEGLKDKMVFQNKIDQLEKDRLHSKREYQNLRTADETAFNDSLRTQSQEATTRMDQKVNDLNAQNLRSLADQKDKNQKEIEARDFINRTEKQSYNQQLAMERSTANERMRKLNENFNEAMKGMEDKNRLGFESLTKVTNEDKSEFMRKMTEQRNNEVYEMKRAFSRLLDGTVQDYEQRLENYRKENENLKVSSDLKIQSIMEETDNKIAGQKKYFGDLRTADLRDHQVKMDQRENDFRTQMNQMNSTYQKKMDQLQIETDRKIKLITNEYETKLKDMSAANAKELHDKGTAHQMEKELLKTAYEQEKTRLIAQYENQISTMKASWDEKLREVKGFKDLNA